LKLQSIPNEWKRANVYPIPKPRNWDAELDNTRPITLLETLRKAFVKLLTNRFTKILVDNNILQWNQFAALPGSLTVIPLHIVNEIIEDSLENKKDLIICGLDMSKGLGFLIESIKID
jgi:hypothetical protein